MFRKFAAAATALALIAAAPLQAQQAQPVAVQADSRARSDSTDLPYYIIAAISVALFALLFRLSMKDEPPVSP